MGRPRPGLRGGGGALGLEILGARGAVPERWARDFRAALVRGGGPPGAACRRG